MDKKPLYLSDTRGPYERAEPTGLFTRERSPYWWMYLGKQAPESTKIRYNGGTRGQTDLNIKTALQKRKERLGEVESGQVAPTVDTTDAMTVKTLLTDWLKTFPKKTRRQKRRFEDVEDHAAHWMQHLGDRQAEKVTPADIRTARKAMLGEHNRHGEPYAPTTIDRWVTTLRACYRDQAPEAWANPCAKVLPFGNKETRVKPIDRAVDLAVIERVIDLMPDIGQSAPQATRHLAVATVNGRRPRAETMTRSNVNLSKVRARLMARTGLPHELVMEILPKHAHWNVRLADGSVVHQFDMQGRMKGHGTKERRRDLTDDAAEALRDFFKYGAVGLFSTSSFYKSWNAACRRFIKAQLAAGEEPLPHVIKMRTVKRRVNGVWTPMQEPEIVPTVRPYDIRHSWITQALKDAPDNIVGVSYHAGHGTLQQTMVYAPGAVPEAASKVTAAMNARHAKQKKAKGRVLKMAVK